MTGTGEITYSSGEVYRGKIKNSSKHGQGSYKTLDGMLYEGRWVNNSKSGRFKVTDLATGKVKHHEKHGDEKNEFEGLLEGETDSKVSLLERARTKFKTLKLKGYDWAILIRRKFLQSWKTTDTGLESVIKRQKLAKVELPSDIAEIEGEFAEEGVAAERFQLGRWNHQGSWTQVIVEHNEEQLRSGDLDEDESKTLAWLLQNSSFRETGEEFSDEQPVIYSLQCLGYKDDIKAKRMTFLYKLPSTPDGKTRRQQNHQQLSLQSPTLLATAQDKQVDFLPITWDEQTSDRGGQASISQSFNDKLTYVFKRLHRNFKYPADEIIALRAVISEILVLGHSEIRGHPNIVRLVGVACVGAAKGGAWGLEEVYGVAEGEGTEFSGETGLLR
ncbi:hypothetical protein HDV63DRAFT_399959 [Trichoderma sp. SZMC 28014]